MKNKKISSKINLTQDVASRLREAIINAEFDFGENLSEELIASALNVSRTPVHEALKILEFEGLVNIIPKSGSYVFTLVEEDIKQLIDFRVILEVNAISYISQERFATLHQKLNGYLKDMQQAIHHRDMRLYSKSDTDFHFAIVSASENKYLTESYKTLLGQVATLRTHLAQKAEGEPQRSFRDHQDLIHLFASGNVRKGEEIKKLLTRHIAQTNRNYLSSFKKEAMPDLMRIKKKLSLL